jgi:hypothetical protein
MEPKDKALTLCQKIGCSTMFSSFNEGMTLPLEISKKIAIICIHEIAEENHDWNKVLIEINKL